MQKTKGRPPKPSKLPLHIEEILYAPFNSAYAIDNLAKFENGHWNAGRNRYNIDIASCPNIVGDKNGSLCWIDVNKKAQFAEDKQFKLMKKQSKFDGGC